MGHYRSFNTKIRVLTKQKNNKTTINSKTISLFKINCGYQHVTTET